MTPFYIVTGFLGSGKTTLLQNILDELGASKKVAVIQNEFAPTGVDGKILKQNNENFHLLEINNGSVFCVCQLNNFVQTVQKLVEDYKPEVIFLESSGLADPISVAELLQTPELNTCVALGGVITIVDAFNFQKGLAGLTRFKHQIMVADIILLNKIDLLSDASVQTIEGIRKLNPFAKIVKTKYASISWDTLSLNTGAGSAADRYVGIESEGRPTLKAMVLRSHQKIARENFDQFIDMLQHSCPRIKGFVNLSDGGVVFVQCVFETREVQLLDNYVGQSELVVFSDSLSISDLRKSFKLFANK